MNTPTHYHGGKIRLARLIVGLLPPHRTYVEPFAGSAAVLFAKPTSPTEILNDLDGNVVNFFRVLRERPDELVRACELTPYARAEYEDCGDLDVDDPVERARRWWARTNQSIGKQAGSGAGWSAAVHSVGQGHNQSRRCISMVNRMHACAVRLRPVLLENLAALEVLARYATRQDVAVYCDPPYLGLTRSRGSAGRDYVVDMASEGEHRILAQALHSTPAAVLLSGYSSSLYDELYGDWHRLECAPRRLVRLYGTEIIWSNRPFSAQSSLWESGERP